MADLKTGWVFMDIKKLRKQLGMTQQELSEITGISRALISNYENEISTPSPQNKELLVRTLFNRYTTSEANGEMREFQSTYRSEAKKLTSESKIIVDDIVGFFLQYKSMKEKIEGKTNGKCELCGNDAPLQVQEYGSFLLPYYVGKTDSLDIIGVTNLVYLCPNCWFEMVYKNDGDYVKVLQEKAKAHIDLFIREINSFGQYDPQRDYLTPSVATLCESLLSGIPNNTLLRFPGGKERPFGVKSIISTYLARVPQEERNLIYIFPSHTNIGRELENFRLVWQRKGSGKLTLFRMDYFRADKLPVEDQPGVVFVDQECFANAMKGVPEFSAHKKFLENRLEKSFVIVLDGLNSVEELSQWIRSTLHLQEKSHHFIDICRDESITEEMVSEEGLWTQVIPPFPTPKIVFELSEILPYLNVKWDYEKNTEVSPKQFYSSSSQKVYWICENGHSYRSSINLRAKNKTSGCPYCAGKLVIPGETDLASQRPDIVKEWDYERNRGITPDQVSLRSNKRVNWICPNGHRYEASVAHRTGTVKSLNPCPVCRSERRTNRS